jgi:UDP-N-acetylmuramoylalanine--D-glutamate ligase
MEILKTKKVLLLGLGILGGGLETAKWFYRKGARLKITDLKSKEELKRSLDKLNKFILLTNSSKRKPIIYILGKHRKEDIDWANIVAVNPAVSYTNELVKYALSKNKEVVNDCYLFFKYAKGDIIALTGTRGKTTTTTWIYKTLKNLNLNKFFPKLKKNKIFLAGNQPDKSLLKILDKTSKNSISILELSSFQLEFYRKGLRAPKIAIITCLLRDHLNRYRDMKEYAKVKANIFLNQTEDDYLVLNYDDKWINFFLKLKPKSRVYFVSFKKLPQNLNGVFIENDKLKIKDEKEMRILNIKNFKKLYGDHNTQNFLFVVLVIYLYLKYLSQIFQVQLDINFLKKYFKNNLLKLETPPFRQEIIYKNKNLVIINDSASTTPQATLVAIKRFYKSQRFRKNFVLIAGGTDKNLDFKELAILIKKLILSSNLILLEGSATKKLINELKSINYKIKPENICQNLKNCLKKSWDIVNGQKKSIILFSPGGASFGKFKNEFDRGKKFNFLVKNILKLN